jgi:hypothetical protein
MAEAAVRVKYFFAHDRNWYYLTTPFIRGALTAPERWNYVRPDTASPSPAAAPGAAAASATASGITTAPGGQMVFNWKKPCVDTMVFSTELQRDMPRTFDDNCFRGDRVEVAKRPDEFRIVFLGGSTVEDGQSDPEMMTTQFKRTLPPLTDGRKVTVVNAGKVGFESRRILLYWQVSVHRFSPDLVLYYEAWNEQPTDVNWQRVDRSIWERTNRIHEMLYYRSMLYTYLVEKFAFLNASKDHFWKIDVKDLRVYFSALARAVRNDGSQFTLVTQVIRFPRMWKGVDTFDYRAVDALLDRLKRDKQYVYSAEEISALNQRLAIDWEIAYCRSENIPVINILDAVEALGDERRGELFVDLGHRSVKGNAFVGELIARSVALSR